MASWGNIEIKITKTSQKLKYSVFFTITLKNTNGTKMVDPNWNPDEIQQKLVFNMSFGYSIKQL